MLVLYIRLLHATRDFFGCFSRCCSTHEKGCLEGQNCFDSCGVTHVWGTFQDFTDFGIPGNTPKNSLAMIWVLHKTTLIEDYVELAPKPKHQLVIEGNSSSAQVYPKVFQVSLLWF